jgi:hypothetical protein
MSHVTCDSHVTAEVGISGRGTRLIETKLVMYRTQGEQGSS